MGNSQVSSAVQTLTTPATPATHAKKAPRLYEAPWRKSESTYKTLVDDITEINPGCVANVLLLGPTGAGKSSTINSILSIAKGRRVYQAYTGNKGTSFTTSYDSFVNEGFLKHCCLWDSMGIEQVLDGGLLLDDLVYLLKGHVKKGYQFNPRSKIKETDPHYRKYPRMEDQTHCVVFVLDSNSVDEEILGPYIQKIKALQEGTRDLHIPCILILTQIDDLCSKVNCDVGNAFRSIKVHNSVRTASAIFDIPEGNIHPLKNYETAVELTDSTSTLVLLALRQLMYFASDRIEELKPASRRSCTVS